MRPLLPAGERDGVRGDSVDWIKIDVFVLVSGIE